MPESCLGLKKKVSDQEEVERTGLEPVTLTLST